MTQAELAKKTGTNKSYISCVETGKTKPKVSTFYRIVDALGLTVELNPAIDFSPKFIFHSLCLSGKICNKIKKPEHQKR